MKPQTIARYCGIDKDMYNQLHRETKIYLCWDIQKQMKQEHNGSYGYEKFRCSAFGMTPHQYKNELARINGFKTRWDMEKRTILKKFKTIKKYFDKKAKERGFKDNNDYKDFLAKENGFKNMKDYQRFRYKKLQEYRKKNNLCLRCGGERDSKFKRCLKCRKYFRGRI